MPEKKKIEPVIVVEGRSDTANLKRFFDCETYETGGSAIDKTDLDRLKMLQKLRGLIVFTDPDFQGERIRKIIMAEIPDAKHAFIRRAEGIPKSRTRGHSLGVEHASRETLETALSELTNQTSNSDKRPDISLSDLVKWGLVMQPDSRRRREYLCDSLRIGYVNGKQLLKRLNMFGISQEKVESTMKKYEEKR